jgi:hypothetical protein
MEEGGGGGAAAGASLVAAASGIRDPDRQWYSGPPFMKDGLSIPMCFRLATEADVKPDGKVQSRWLWRGGAPPKPPPRRRAAAAAAAPVGGKRRRRGRGGGGAGGDEDGDGEDGNEGDMDFAVEKPTGDLRDALKRHRAEAPPAVEGEAAEGDAAAEGAAAAAAAGEGAAGGDAMDGAGASEASGVDADAPLPPGDLRTALLSPPDFGDDPVEAGGA